jgi:hypothetical protein
MPKLLIFAPCDKVIVGDDRTSSLIMIYETLTLTLPAPSGGAIPAELVIPSQWNIYTLWHREPTDIGKKFEMNVQFVLPDGNIMFEVQQEFEMTARNYRNIGVINGLPVGVPGECLLKLLLREDAGEWQQVEEYPLEVQHTPPGS